MRTKARILDLLIIGVLTFLGEAFTQFFQESKLLPYLAMAIEAVAAFTR
jgi:hypothetical protein